MGWNEGVALVADRSGALVAVDRDGCVVWRAVLPFGPSDVQLSLQGTLLAVGSGGRGEEFGFDGRRLHRWQSGPGAGTGAVVAGARLQGSLQEIAPDIYLGVSDGAVLVFDRRGAVYWLWPLAERLGGAGAFQVASAVMDPTDGGVLLALPERDVVAKLDRRGRLVWQVSRGDGAAPGLAGVSCPRQPRRVVVSAGGEVIVGGARGVVAFRVAEGVARETGWFDSRGTQVLDVAETPARTWMCLLAGGELVEVTGGDKRLRRMAVPGIREPVCTAFLPPEAAFRLR